MTAKMVLCLLVGSKKMENSIVGKIIEANISVKDDPILEDLHVVFLYNFCQYKFVLLLPHLNRIGLTS